MPNKNGFWLQLYEYLASVLGFFTSAGEMLDAMKLPPAEVSKLWPDMRCSDICNQKPSICV